MIGTIKLMHRNHGDLALAEWDTESTDSLIGAELVFREHFRDGRFAFGKIAGNTFPIDRFMTDLDGDPIESILIVPAIQGG